MFSSFRMSWVAKLSGDFMNTRLWGMEENATRFTVGSQSPGGSDQVPLYKARGGPHVYLSVYL